MKTLCLTILMAIIFPLISLAQQVPALTGPVVDLTGTITTKNEMEKKIRAIYKEGQGPQVSILVIERLDENNTIEQYSHKVFTTWKLGDAKRDDGVLFVVATKSRKVRIEVGQGLEGSLTDLHSKRILASIRSELGSGRFSEGLNKGLDLIIDKVTQVGAVQGEPVKKIILSPEQLAAEKEKQQQILNLVGMMALSVLLVGGFFVVLSRQLKEVGREKSLFVEKSQENQRLYSKIKSVEDKYNQKISDATLSLQKKEKAVKVELSKTKYELSEIEDVYAKSPKVKLTNLNSQLVQEKKYASSIEQNINEYEKIIKKGLK